jgi:Tfp pilus assembly protein PilX
MYIRGNRGRRGNALVLTLLVVVAILGLCAAIMRTTVSHQADRVTSVSQHEALRVADAGIAHAYANLAALDDADVVEGDEVQPDLGSSKAPVEFGGGSYWVDVQENADSTWTLTSYASVRGSNQAVQVMLSEPEGGIYNNAIFAGNSDEDPTYELDLGGTGGQADYVEGDVFSGGSVEVKDDAKVDGVIRAKDAITGADGVVGEGQAIPDLLSPDYSNTADVKVKDLFSSATYKSDALGGKAWELPESSPAHIFRRNPSDRTSNTSTTAKDDYFLEDPFEPVYSDTGSTGANACPITISGLSGEPGVSGNQLVYFIDGNLWIHNTKTYSFKITNGDASGVQITFVVKGNIYFSDNLFYKDDEDDGLAFIAMEDAKVADSGNIYFGDPVFGTLEEMHAFMYAENNFYDTNLDAKGSAIVDLYGNMTAGNQVQIQRDYGTQHSKLGVYFDDRIATSVLKLPKLPPWIGSDSSGWVVAGSLPVATE